MVGIWNVLETLFVVATLILTIVGNWMLFKKAGRPGWAAIVPFYSVWLDYQIAWTPLAAIIATAMSVTAILSGVILVFVLVGTLLSGLASIFMGGMAGFASALSSSMLLVVIFTISVIVFMVMNLLQTLFKAYSFGKDWKWALGLYFLPVVFLSMLAFDKNVSYQGSTEIQFSFKRK